MSFTDQKQHTVTAEDLKAPWSGYKDGSRFYCRLCGHKFKIRDLFRWVYAGSIDRVNLLVCRKCDGPDVLERWEKWWEEWEYLAKTKLRYIADRLVDAEKN